MSSEITYDSYKPTNEMKVVATAVKKNLGSESISPLTAKFRPKRRYRLPGAALS